MKAAIINRYGTADTIRIEDRPVPEPAPNEVRVRVAAAAVTSADWRLRASAFPGGLWLIGRLATGLTRPRHAVPGSAFAGTVDAIGPEARGFALGNRVFGFTPHGAHADYLTIRADAAVAPMPESLDFEDAAALPFGATSALIFLRDVARLAPGEHVLIVGASGGVGAHAVQIARAMGARVTAVASGPNETFVRALGADEFMDYRQTDPLDVKDRYDVILDTVGATTFARAKPALRSDGRYVPLNFSLADLVRGALSRFRGGKAMRIAVSGDTRADLDILAKMVTSGDLRPVVERVLPFDRIAEAHALIETRHRRGAIVLSLDTTDNSSLPRAA